MFGFRIEKIKNVRIFKIFCRISPQALNVSEGGKDKWEKRSDLRLTVMNIRQPEIDLRKF